MSELFIAEDASLNTSIPCAMKHRALNGNPLQHSSHYTYHQFNIQQFYVLPTQLYLWVLRGSEKKKRLFPYTALTDWFIAEKVSVYCAVRAGSLYIIPVHLRV
jgi:hypothetical protein